jgi:hypothetical protein
MAKAIRAFSGNNTYGTPVEVAQSINGAWFQRYYEYNGYACAWSKWVTFLPAWSDTITNAYSLEVSVRDEPALQCGFSILMESSIVPRYRLPA